MPLGTFLIAGSAPWTANRRVREKKRQKNPAEEKRWRNPRIHSVGHCGIHQQRLAKNPAKGVTR